MRLFSWQNKALATRAVFPLSRPTNTPAPDSCGCGSAALRNLCNLRITPSLPVLALSLEAHRREIGKQRFPLGGRKRHKWRADILPARVLPRFSQNRFQRRYYRILPQRPALTFSFLLKRLRLRSLPILKHLLQQCGIDIGESRNTSFPSRAQSR